MDPPYYILYTTSVLDTCHHRSQVSNEWLIECSLLSAFYRPLYIYIYLQKYICKYNIYIFFLVIAMPPLLNIHHIGFQMLHRFCPLEVGAFGRVSPRGGHCFINHNFHMYSKKTNIIYINKYTLIETSVIMMVIDHHQLIALKLGSFLF